MSTVQFSIRMDPEIKERLDQQAKREDRSAAYIAQRAIDAYVSKQERLLEMVRLAEIEADKGVFISEEKVDAWVNSWGTEDELPPPQPDIFPKPTPK
jgi:predicted transcriptional regulator